MKALRFKVGNRVSLRNHRGYTGDIVYIVGDRYIVDVHPGAVDGYEYLTVVGTKYRDCPLNIFCDNELDYLDPKRKI